MEENQDRDYTKLEIEIFDFMYDFEKKKKVVYYLIRCRYGKMKWEAKRRYKQFERLHNLLKAAHTEIPGIPPKSLFTIKEGKGMEKRMEGLNAFIKGIISREEVYCNLYFLDFFEFRKMIPLFCLNQMVCIGKIANGKLGYREAFFSIEENIAITASHDIYVASRFDSYFTNFFSSKKKEEKEASLNSSKEKAVGKVEFLRRHDVKDVMEQLEDKKSSRRRDREMVELEEPDEKAPVDAKAGTEKKETDEVDYFNYIAHSEKNFKAQVISLAWSSELKEIACGLDSGDIYTYSYDPILIAFFQDEKSYIKVHTKRVMKVVFDTELNRLISIGEDKKTCVIDLGKKELISRLELPGGKLTNIVYHQQEHIGVIADRNNSIFVVDYTKKSPDLLRKVNPGVKGPIRGLEACWEENLLFVSSQADGLIKVFQLENLRASAELSLLFEIHSVPGARCMFYWRRRKELYVGYEKGVMNVFGNISSDVDSKPPVIRKQTTCSLY